MLSGLADERRVFLSTEFAGPRAVRFALAVVSVSALFFAAIAPYAAKQLPPVAAFIPAYESALIVCDLITALLLFGQFNFLRARALLVLACGYLYTAFIAFAHVLTFPGVFAPTGLLGAGSQSTGWLYLFWHGGFPLFILVYALSRPDGRESMGRGSARLAIPAAVAAVFAIVCALVFVATADQDFVPALLLNNRFTPAFYPVVSVAWLLSFAALIFLWRRRPHTVLGLWLMVVMCAWLFDIALSAVLNAGRYDLGWYAGRIYGLLAASFVLIVLLFENSMHYSRLVHLSGKLSVANKALELLSLHDGLTGLANRRFFDSTLEEQIAVARRHKRTLALVMCDVDAFKAYNDCYGHQAGDDCLKQVAAAMRACCRRPGDMAARYGGEEFAMILPDTELTGAAQIAEAVREAVAQLRIPHANSPAGPYVSISGGIATLRDSIDITAEQLIKAADQTLYLAKGQGRNRMVSMTVQA
jgi:diguanylate cyclase (GGDEF)-like protein